MSAVASVKPVLLLLIAVLACGAQSRTQEEHSAAQTKERTNAPVHLDTGPLKLDVYISETAQLFHVVDQISQWSEFSHRQYVRYFESRAAD
jgi:type IV pilus biogenesis protein CpaD/CtpE